MSRYRHIVWDWNGTLLDDLDYSIEVMNGLLRRRHLPLLDRARYHRLFDFPVRDYYGRLGFDPTVDTFERLSVEFISGYDANRLTTKLHAHVKEILPAVTRAGLTQSVLSAYRQQTLEEIVGHFGLTSHFVRLNGLDNIHAHSKTELGRAWLDELALPRSEVLLIGDTLHDYEVARELGVDCVLVAAGHHPAERLAKCATRVYANLAELSEELGFMSPTGKQTG